VICPESNAADVISAAAAQGVHAWRLGVVTRGSGQVVLN
jgi:hypothetical protein